jgi:hypothetical protein
MESANIRCPPGHRSAPSSHPAPQPLMRHQQHSPHRRGPHGGRSDNNNNPSDRRNLWSRPISPRPYGRATSSPPLAAPTPPESVSPIFTAYAPPRHPSRTESTILPPHTKPSTFKFTASPNTTFLSKTQKCRNYYSNRCTQALDLRLQDSSHTASTPAKNRPEDAYI